MKEKIRIASGQGFWGDLPNAPADQVRGGPIDYLVLDYLAEVTMSIMQKQRMRNPDGGYARDFIEMLDDVLPEAHDKGVRIIANAGGVNPLACKDAILSLAGKHQITGLKIAVVEGDDILPSIEKLMSEGHSLKNMETNEPLEVVKDQLLSANVYFGSRPVAEALEEGADIVITGRIIDAGLVLGPLIYEFDWKQDDYHKLASGIVAGHLIECGGQVSGGNFTDWEDVDRLADLGFPLIEAFPDSTFHVTKHPDTGGRVDEMTVKEQLIYEISDPSKYITPDVTADFTTVKIDQIEENRVGISGIQGYPETETYKVSASYRAGYKITSSLVYSWPDAVKKARAASDILRERAKRLGLRYDDFRTEFVGVNACSEDPEDLHNSTAQVNEVEMRVSARGKFREDLYQLGKQIVPLILTGPGGVTGYAGGRPKVSEVIAFWPALLDKKMCHPKVSIYET